MKRLPIILAIVAIVLLNMIANAWFVRWDLTEEKRYSISPISETLLEGMRKQLYVEVYLDGDFPARLRSFQDVVRTTLVEMDQYAGTSVDFSFISPDDNPELMQSLRARGFAPQQVKVRRSATEVETRPVWPVARTAAMEIARSMWTCFEVQSCPMAM